MREGFRLCNLGIGPESEGMGRLFDFDESVRARVLATDLDGTLIPLPDSQANLQDLRTLGDLLREGDHPLIFATGRSFDSTMEAISSHGLPTPDWIVCDVGSAIYRREDDAYIAYAPYVSHLRDLVQDFDRARIEQRMATLEGLQLQEAVHQQEFKISFLSPPELLEELVSALEKACREEGLPFSPMGCIDPFDNCGLIDILPIGVNKGYALIWLATHADFDPSEVVFSGDSGNDFAALVCGFRATVVSNASQEVRTRVTGEVDRLGYTERVFYATKAATSGVLEGARHHGLF